MSPAVLRMACASLLRNRLRSALAVLAVAIGIAAVICTAAIGAGASARVQAQLDALGENFLWIRSGAATVSGARSGIGWPSIMSAEVAAWAILLAAAAGLGFGYLPAHRASALDPIEALQIES